MSGYTDSVVGLVLFAPVALAAASVGLVAAVPVLLVRELVREYEEAKREYDAKTLVQMQERLENFECQRRRTEELSELTRQTIVRPDVDATMLMLQNSATLLWNRIARLEDCPPDIKLRLESLLSGIGSPDVPCDNLLQEYRELARDISGLAETGAKVTSRESETLSSELRALRDRISERFSTHGEWGHLRERFLERAAELEDLGKREPAQAGQGLALLRERVSRELQRCSESEETGREESEHVRALTCDLLAKLDAVSAICLQEGLRGLSERSVRLRRQISEALSTEADDLIEKLSGGSREVDRLFLEASRRVVGARVSCQVRDVLHSLGYRVSVIPLQESDGEGRFISGVTPDVGVEFCVDEQGGLMTQMVSLSGDLGTVSEPTQEMVCELVDKVFATLRRRGVDVRERCRRTLDAGSRLRQVSVESNIGQAFEEHSPAPRYLEGEIR
jgi:hypothetical protein